MEKNNLYITGLADKCTNCGNCRIICPVFKVTGEEIYSTRGRINLIKGFLSNELQPSSDLSNKLFVCLNCRQCLELCPADVEYTEIIKHAKSRLRPKNKIFAIKRSVLEGIFSHNTSSSDLYFLLLRKSRKFLSKNNTLNYFGKLIFRLAGLNSSVNTPDIPLKNFFKMGIRHKLKNDRGFRIALFTGCGGKHLYPDCADNFVKIMRSEGIETVIPKNQVCCGNPLSYKGFIKSADKNVNINSSLFNSLLDIRNIVSLCPGAGNLFQEFNHPDSIPYFRLPVKNWICFLTENKIEVAPKYDNSIIFHSCPKCGQTDLYRDFVDDLYKGYTQTPGFTGEFCGCTELLDRSNYELRNTISRSFYDKNSLDKADYIACSSFECIEHLNEFFTSCNLKIRAIHFIDAVKTKK